MSLKEYFKSKLKKLCDAFNDSAWPEPEIQNEMEQEGWKFDIVPPQVMYASLCPPMLFVTTPEGRSVYNADADPKDEARYRQVLAEKRIARGLRP